MCLCQLDGHASQCYSSPTVWVALGTAVVDLLCVEPGPMVCLIGRIRRHTQGTGRGRKGHWKGQGCFGKDPNYSVIQHDSE